SSPRRKVSMLIPSNNLSANAPPRRGFVFGRPAAPVSLFSFPLPWERDGAPGGAQEVCETSSAGFARPSHTPRFRVPGLRGKWGSRGARALARSPGASRRSIAARIVGGRTLRWSSGVAIDDARRRARHALDTGWEREEKIIANYGVNS